MTKSKMVVLSSKDLVFSAFINEERPEVYLLKQIRMWDNLFVAFTEHSITWCVKFKFEKEVPKSFARRFFECASEPIKQISLELAQIKFNTKKLFYDLFVCRPNACLLTSIYPGYKTWHFSMRVYPRNAYIRAKRFKSLF